MIRSLHQLRHGGHDLILFHVLDEAEIHFPFRGSCEFLDPESGQKIGSRCIAVSRDYLKSIEQFRRSYREQCQQAGVDYVELDTSMPFDKALTEYLVSRRARC